MPYNITNFDGTPLVTVADSTLNTTSTSLALIGRNAVNFGLAMNENFIALLQHFSSSTPPANPVPGQIWFNNVTSVLNFYDGTQWNTLSPPYDGNAGTATVLITSVTPHVEVLIMLSAGKIISACSNFHLNPADLPVYALIGDINYTFKDRFPTGILPGITLATDSEGYQFNGTARTANALASSRTISLAGSTTGNVRFDGSNDVIITNNLINVLNANVTVNGYYTKVKVSSNGLIMDANSITSTDVFDALAYTPPALILFQGDVTGNTVSNGTVMTANIYINSSNVTPGYYSNIKVDGRGIVVGANNDNAVPTTGIIIWPGPVIPTGWAECNGQQVTTPKGTIITPNMTSYAVAGTRYIMKIS